MSQFECKIVYIKGDDNCVVDALSRLPIEMTEEEQIARDKVRGPYDFCADEGAFSVMTILLQTGEESPWKAANAIAETDTFDGDMVGVVLSVVADAQL